MVQSLQRVPLPEADFKIETGDGARLIELWERYDQVILIDAACALDFIRFIDVGQEDVPRDLISLSSHSFSIGETIALAKALKRMPREFHLIAVPARDFTLVQEPTENPWKNCNTMKQIVDFINRIFRSKGDAHA
jgi:hydrogenase maturation protease